MIQLGRAHLQHEIYLAIDKQFLNQIEPGHRGHAGQLEQMPGRGEIFQRIGLVVCRRIAAISHRDLDSARSERTEDRNREGPLHQEREQCQDTGRVHLVRVRTRRDHARRGKEGEPREARASLSAWCSAWSER
ncbi:hypothetical protein D3C71_1799410 [compost metagenome]